MPSLWKRGQSPYWVCCYTSADGQRLKKSTKQKDRVKAWEVCLGIERAEQFARAGKIAAAEMVRKVEIRDEAGIRSAQLDGLFPADRSFIHAIDFVDRCGEVFSVIIGDIKYLEGELYFFDRRSGRRLSNAFSLVPETPDLDGELSATNAAAIARFAEDIAGCRVARHGGLERLRGAFDLTAVPGKWKILFSAFR